MGSPRDPGLEQKRGQVSRPRLTELRQALALVDREIAKFPRAIGKGGYSSLEQALGTAEQRRVAIQAELAELDWNQQPAVVQITPAKLEDYLSGDDRETPQRGARRSPQVPTNLKTRNIMCRAFEYRGSGYMVLKTIQACSSLGIFQPWLRAVNIST